MRKPLTYQGVSRKDLQKGDQIVPVPQVFVEIIHVFPNLHRINNILQSWNSEPTLPFLHVVFTYAFLFSHYLKT